VSFNIFVFRYHDNVKNILNRILERTFLDVTLRLIFCEDDFNFLAPLTCMWGHAVAWWLSHYATNRKVAGSIPDEMNF
jgi:hypothetical protein